MKIETEAMMKVNVIPKGEFVKRKPTSKEVFTRGEFDRSQGKYELNSESDISKSIYVKSGTMLFVGFTY